MGKFTGAEIFILLIIIVETFIKSITSIMVHNRQYVPLDDKNFSILKYYSERFSDIMNVLFIMVSIYLLLVKKAKKPIYLIICYMLIFKAIMHFLVDDNIYKRFNLSLKTQEKLVLFKSYETAFTNVILGSMTLYVLSVVF
jgi:hypothetical protein